MPLAPRRLTLASTGPGPALRIYRPHRRVARLASRLHPPLLRLRLAAPTAAPALPDLDGLLTRRAHPALQLTMMRSSAPDRWVVAAADHQRLHTLVNVGRNDRGSARERAALSTLRSTPAVTLPEILGYREKGGWRALAAAALPRTDQPPALHQVVDLATALTRGDLGVPVVHGDLAPWNLAVDGERIAVWDWEEAELETARPLHDLTHYILRSGTLLGSWTPDEAARLLTAADGPGARHLRALSLPAATATDLVHDYLRRTEPANPREQAYRTAFAERLPVAS